MMQTRYDAIIVGAGPAGSTAAILLARAGWSVALVEKHAFPRRKVCGECIAASNLPLLDALGLGAAFDVSAGPALRRVALMQGERTLVADLPAAEPPGPAWGRALGRETLDTLLLEQARADGAVVFQPWLLQASGGTAGNHRCELRAVGSDQRLWLDAPVLIDAHGSWESLPSGRATWFSVCVPGDLLAFKANFCGSRLAEGLLPVLSFSGGYGGMVLAGRGVTTVACCIRRDRLEASRLEMPGARAGDVVEALLRRACSGVAEALKGAEREGAWLAAGPIRPGVRLPRDDAPFRIGNAAGEAHPIIGEGMSMAMQSAWLLCAQLLRPARPRSGVSSDAWHREVRDRYADEWRRHFVPRVRLAAALAHLAMRPGGAAPLIALLDRWRGLLTHTARWSGKLRCAPDPATIAWLASGRASKHMLPADACFSSFAPPDATRQEMP